MTLSPNTVLLMHMDDNVNDAIGRHTPSAIGSPTYSAGQSGFGNAISLNGSSQYVQVADSDDWDFGSGDFTIDAKVNFDTLQTCHIVAQWSDGGDSNKSFTFNLRDGNKLQFAYSTGGTSGTSLESDVQSLSTGTWYHVAVVRDGATVRFFLDGVAIGTGNISTNTIANSTRNLNIGTYEDGGGSAGEWVDGLIDEVRIVKGEAIWTSNFTPPISPYSLPNENLIGTFLYATGNIQQSRSGKNFNNIITSMSLNRIYEGQYGQDSNARIYGSIEPEIGTVGESGVLLMHMDDDVVDATGKHTPSAVGSPSYVSGVSGFNNAVSLNGSTQYIGVADSDDFTFTSDATIDFKIKFNALPANGYMIDHVQDGNNRWGMQYTSGDGIDFFYINTGSTYRVSQGSAAGWSIDTWYHLAVVIEDTGVGCDVTVYRDGTSIASGSKAAKMNNYAGLLYIGCYNGASNFTNCVIDELRIVKGEAVWKSDFSPEISPYTVNANSIKFYADPQNLYQVAEYYAIASSGTDVVLIGSGIGDGLSGVFSYSL